MGFGEAMTSALWRRYARFTGRSPASEVWWLLGVDAMAFFVLGATGVLPIPLAVGDGLAWAPLVLLVPSLAVTARRLHDIGRPGWWCLLVLVPPPGLGLIAAVVVACLPAEPGPNRYGPPPARPRTSVRGRYPTPATSDARRCLQALLGAVIGAVTWAAWLGWDTRYYRDTAGQVAGPHRPWQVAACVVTLAVVVMVLALRWSPFVVSVGVGGGFWVVWTIWSVSIDDSSMVGAGAALLLMALIPGTTLAAGVGYGLRTPAHRLLSRRRP